MARRILAFSRGNHHGLSNTTPPTSPKLQVLEGQEVVERRSSLNMDIFHRKSDKPSSLKGSPKLRASKAAGLNISIESPPLVLYGNTDNSSGALFSGQLELIVFDKPVAVQSYTMVLHAKVTTRKPIHKDCTACSFKLTELKTWNFLSEQTAFRRETTHSFPFSHLLDGKLPATTHGILGSIEYILTATVVTTLETITKSHTLDLKRALQPPAADRMSTRIFPPTKLKAEVTHPPVIHPIGEFNVSMRLTGVISSDATLIRRWRLRKMSWRIDENSTIVSPPCQKHMQKVGEGKGVRHTDSRDIGSKDLKDGWKSDFSASENNGVIEIEFPISVHTTHHHKPVCDVENPTGFTVDHKLVLELIVAEEVAGHKYNKSFGATGTARVLRMQFGVIMTERGGLGISWDEEMPPIYSDVPASPPTYPKIEDYIGEVPEESEVLDLHY